MEVITASKLEKALLLEEKPDETSTKAWDKMNRAACGIIRSYLKQNIKYHVMTETSAKNIWEILVTLRSRGYRDVTATYICRSKIPSRIYAKHQYRQESEYGST